jgi:hypothetical protein
MRFKPDALSLNAWAVKAGVSRTVWTDMRRHGNPSRRTLEKLLNAVGSSLLEFEALRLGPEPRRFAAGATGQVGDMRSPWGVAPLPPIPLVRSRLGGEWGEPGSQIELTELSPDELLERLPRPVSLAADPEAFALTVVGDAMWPRFRPGSRIAVSPRAPVAIGDDVLVRLRSAGGTEGIQRVLITQLVKRTSRSVELRQFNPDRSVDVDAGEVDAIQKIAGELI